MSLFNKMFGGNEEKFQAKSYWNIMETEEDLKNAIKESSQQKVAIFKHSTSCFISKTVLRNFEKEIEQAGAVPGKLYFLDLLAHRNLSNKIAQDLGVRHESPQLLMIENGKVTDHASHQSISFSML